jgi:cytochrome bd-type quinol oxidase subunit 2
MHVNGIQRHPQCRPAGGLAGFETRRQRTTLHSVAALPTQPTKEHAARAKVPEIFNDYNKILLIFLTVVISVFSYYFVEKTFRNKKYPFQKVIIILLISVFSLKISTDGTP